MIDLLIRSLDNFIMRKLFLFVIAIALCGSSVSMAESPQVIRVGVLTNIPPRSFMASPDNRKGIRGMDIDILSQLESAAKVRFEYVKCETLSQRRKYFEEKFIDVEAFSEILNGELPGARFIPVGLSNKTRLYVHDSCKTVVCSRDLADKRVAVIIGTRYQPYIEEVRPDNLVIVDTSLQGLKMLNSGTVDVFLAPSQIVADYIVQKENLEHVLRVGMVLGEFALGLTVREGDKELQSRFERALAALHRSGTIKLIEDKWYGVTYPASIWESRYFQALCALIVVAISILPVMSFWNYQLQKRVRKISADLQSSDLRYRAFVESSPDMILVLDEKGRILTTNPKAQSTLSSSRLIKNMADVIVERDREKFRNYLKCILTDGSCSEEFNFTDAQGHVLEVDVAAARIPSDNTNTQLICCFARDVTEANRIKQELVKADRMSIIGQMAAGVAHEINNPLGIIRTNIELIVSQGWFSEKAKDFVESSLRNTIRAGKIIKDLLAVAKPKNPEMDHINLLELIQSTLAVIGAQIKYVDVRLDSKGETPYIWGDRHQIQQVLVNIFLNATDAMKSLNEPSMNITCCVPPKSATVRIRVEDAGPGIQRGKLYNVFEPFVSHGKPDGFGLGLFISKMIVEAHNGIIFAESDEGKGAQITIEFPLSENLNGSSKKC